MKRRKLFATGCRCCVHDEQDRFRKYLASRAPSTDEGLSDYDDDLEEALWQSHLEGWRWCWANGLTDRPPPET